MNFPMFVFGVGFGVVVGCLIALTFFTGPIALRQLASIESLLRELVQARHRQEMDR